MGALDLRTGDKPGSGNPGATGPRKVLRQPIGLQRAEFLRSCRARIQPADLGLPAPQRKRTEGLRREDVAALSGVSVAWYTWLEQGRDMRVSDEVLERICHTFRLTEEEREYLFSLVQQRPPRMLPESRDEAPPEIARMIHGLGVPGVVMNLRWDLLAWNPVSVRVFRDYSQLPREQRNLAEILLTTEALQRNPVEFEAMIKRVLAKMRVDFSKAADDPEFQKRVRRLESLSPVFRRIWHSPEFNVGSYGVYHLDHGTFGPLAFEHTSHVPEGYPGLRVTVCVPHDQPTRAALARISAEAATT